MHPFFSEGNPCNISCGIPPLAEAMRHQTESIDQHICASFFHLSLSVHSSLLDYVRDTFIRHPLAAHPLSTLVLLGLCHIILRQNIPTDCIARQKSRTWIQSTPGMAHGMLHRFHVVKEGLGSLLTGELKGEMDG
jgi:hypothetical protein